MAVEGHPDFDTMPKRDLMLYARKELQIQVRVRSNKGKLNAYRPVKHVREDCKKEVAKRMLPVSSMEVSGTPSKRRYSRCANESQMETPAKRKRNARTGPVQPNKDMADTKPFGSHVGFSPKHSYTRRKIKDRKMPAFLAIFVAQRFVDEVRSCRTGY